MKYGLEWGSHNSQSKDKVWVKKILNLLSLAYVRADNYAIDESEVITAQKLTWRTKLLNALDG